MCDVLHDARPMAISNLMVPKHEFALPLVMENHDLKVLPFGNVEPKDNSWNEVGPLSFIYSVRSYDGESKKKR